MIKSLEIKNFKSIKHLSLDCKRVNLFIGKPNTGKSNLLESVGIFSLPFASSGLKDFIRFENVANLFYDQNVNERIEIIADRISLVVSFFHEKLRINHTHRDANERAVTFESEFDYSGKGNLEFSPAQIKFYRFLALERFTRWETSFLLPPRGENLLQILLTHKDLRKIAANFFSEYGLKMALKPQEQNIEVQKDFEEVIVSYPYSLVSDTLQRAIFYHAAIETNKDSTLIFEEPEAHSFPFYTKFLAERIALDASNQYFITTHNPYFLSSVLEKTPISDVAIFITYMEDYQTKVRPIALEEMPEILDLDASVFFNLERFLGEL